MSFSCSDRYLAYRSTSRSGAWLSGGTPQRNEPTYWGGDVPWIGSKDLKPFDLDDSSEFVTEDGARAGSRVVDAGAVLFVTRGMSLAKEFRVGVATRRLAFNQDVKAIVPRDDLDCRFLAWFLRASERYVLDQCDTATHGTKRLPLERIESLPVPLPPLAEQRRIAAILDEAGALREMRRKSIALLDALVGSTFLEMFGDPVTNPRAWPTTALGDVSESFQYGTSTKCCESEAADSLPVLRIPNVVGGRVNWSDLKYAALSDTEVQSLRLAPGDLLFVRTNGNPDYIARCAVVPDGGRDSLFASYLIRLRFRIDAGLLPSYVQAVVSAPSYRSVIEREARTTAGNYNISAEGLRSLVIPRPPLRDQRAYEAFIAATSRERATLAGALLESERLFASLLSETFRTIR